MGKIKIDKKRIVCWSQKRETNYTYYDDKLGEMKVKIIERINDEGKDLGPAEVRIFKDNYCIPELTRAVFEKHHKLKDSQSA